MSFPVFASGDVLNASDMNAVGLWLVKSQTVGTGVSSVTVTSAFSADYDAYKLVYTGGVTSAAVANLTLQLGASTTGYFSCTFFAGVAAGTVANAGVNNGANWTYGGLGTNTHIGLDLDLINPFLATNTLLSNAIYADSSTFGTTNGRHAVNTSYSAFTLAVGSGTMTGGTIAVYGYKK